MTGHPPNDSRNREDHDRIAAITTNFTWTVRMQGIDAAALSTITWPRRHVLDVALELAKRSLDATHALEEDIRSTARSEQHRARMAQEEATWTVPEARRAHQRYQAGERGLDVREGHRVFIRRQRRAKNVRALDIHYGDLGTDEDQPGGAA